MLLISPTAFGQVDQSDLEGPSVQEKVTFPVMSELDSLESVLEDWLKESVPILDVLDCPWTSGDSCEQRECAIRLVGFVLDAGLSAVGSAVPGGSFLVSGLSGMVALPVHPGIAALMISDVLIRAALRNSDLFRGIPTTIGDQGGARPGGPRTECLGYFPVVGGTMGECMSLLVYSSCHGMINGKYTWFCGPLEVTGPSRETAHIQCPWQPDCMKTERVRQFWDGVRDEIEDMLASMFEGAVFSGIGGFLDSLLPEACGPG